jgi:hypothetical protein
MKVYIRAAAHFSGHYHLPGGAKSLDGHMALRIAGEKLVKKSVAYLVGHLVGVPFGN